MKANTVSEVSSPAAAGFSTAATTGGGNGRGVLPATRPLPAPGRVSAALPGVRQPVKGSSKPVSLCGLLVSKKHELAAAERAARDNANVGDIQFCTANRILDATLTWPPIPLPSDDEDAAYNYFGTSKDNVAGLHQSGGRGLVDVKTLTMDGFYSHIFSRSFTNILYNKTVSIRCMVIIEDRGDGPVCEFLTFGEFVPQEAAAECDSAAQKGAKSKLRKFFKNHKTDSNEAHEGGV